MSRHHTAWALVHIGSNFASRSAPGSAIRNGLGDPSVTDIGYDGQFSYYLAAAPFDAQCCLDAPAYRYGRIAYPLAARAVALAQPSLIPYALLGINLAALAGTVLLLASWLRRHGRSAWWATVYGFYPGLFQALQTDVSEVSAYALVAAAVYVLEFGGRRRLIWGGLLFGLAGLTRETTLLFPAVYALAGFLGNRGRGRLDGVALAVLAAGPYIAYKVVLAVSLGSLGVGLSSGGGEVATLPLAGLFSFWPLEPREWIQFAGEAIPTSLVAGLAIFRLLRGAPRSELLAYLVNYLALVLLLQRSSYFSYFDSGRIQTGVILAAIIALPVLLGGRQEASDGQRSLWVAALLMGAACVLWFLVVPAGLAAPHSLHVFKL